MLATSEKRNQMTRIILLVACSSENGQPSNQKINISSTSDTTKNILQESNRTPLINVHSPNQKLTITVIDSVVSEIDKFIESGKWRMESVYGLNNEPCEIVKYYMDSTLIKIERGCGDCSSIMSSEKYYFKDNSLIQLKKYVIDYGYNPCWSEQECIEYGVTEEFKKEKLRERNEKYYFLDNEKLSFFRTGNFSDTSFFKNDTLLQMTILKDANEYLNATE